jgi:hypothetical protein
MDLLSFPLRRESRKFGEAESLDASGEKGITHKELFRRLKAKIK